MKSLPKLRLVQRSLTLHNNNLKSAWSPKFGTLPGPILHAFPGERQCICEGSNTSRGVQVPRTAQPNMHSIDVGGRWMNEWAGPSFVLKLQGEWLPDCKHPPLIYFLLILLPSSISTPTPNHHPQPSRLLSLPFPELLITILNQRVVVLAAKTIFS